MADGMGVAILLPEQFQGAFLMTRSHSPRPLLLRRSRIKANIRWRKSTCAESTIGTLSVSV